MKQMLVRSWGWVRDAAPTGRPSWRSASVVGMVVALVVAAVVVDGYRTAKFELDEASVWATNGSLGVSGRINTLAGQVEVVSRPAAEGAAVNVFQRGREVLLYEPGKSLTALDAATGNPAGAGLALDSTGDGGSPVEVAAGGGNVALKKGGRLWITRFADLEGVDLEKRKGSVAVASDSTIVLGPTGAVYAISPTEGTIRHVGGPDGDVEAAKLKVETAGGMEAVVVGATPVVLSISTGTLQIGDRMVDVATHGANPRLQDGPATGKSVLVATDSSLVAAPLADGTVRTIDDSGTGSAVRPVKAGRCSYGAWAGTGDTAPPQMVRRCGTGVASKAIEPFTAAQARFRVNGTYVVLNRLDDGKSFMLRDTTLVVIDNWADLQNETPDEEEVEDDDTEDGDAECAPTPENSPPQPGPDEFGARAGVATVLDVLGNDRDADCDVLAIVGQPSDIVGAATILPVDRGHALQFTADAGATGTVTFRYLVSDGRSQPVGTNVTVTLRPPDANEPPEQAGTPKISVGKGQTVAFNVLESFVDPDGDAVILEAADLPMGALGTVRAEPNGTVTFTDDGSSAAFDIALRVSDGRDGALGKLAVEMVADPSPVARNDHALGLVDQPVTVEVLANDTAMPGQEISLTAAESSEPGTAVQMDTTAGLVIFTASAPGTYRVPYTVASGPKQAEAYVRVDVSEPTGNVAPIAVRDNATVVVGGSTVVDLVSNDYDVNLDVLVVSSVVVPPGSGLTVQLLEQRAVRITASRLPDSQPVVIDYWVTDGESDPVSGQLQLQVVTTGLVNQPPLARDDVAVVRAGDVVTVPVLVNDVDPDGDPLKVESGVSVNVADGAAAPGVAFATTNAVRFVAGAEPGATSISYQVTDGISGTDSALVRLTIVPAGPNQAPVPRTLDARTLVDAPVRINVPTFGIDPDGDLVSLALDRQPSKGTVALVEGCDCFDYTPSTGKAGTDVFTYTATDAGGLSGSATIRVGIGLRHGANQPPVAVEDKVKVRPGRKATVPVLANDSDPDNDPIELVDEPLIGRDGVSARVVGDRVQVNTGGPATVPLAYQVTDGKQSTPGQLTVEVTDSAPLLPPVARDDTAELPKDRSKAVLVDVLANDEDQDGSIEELKVAVHPSVAAIASLDGRRISVTLGDRPVVVPYTITDADELSATAVIRVPAANTNLPPRLKAGLDPIAVEGGTTIEIELDDVAEDPEGSDVLLVPGDFVKGDHGTATATGPTTLSFTADADYTGVGAVAFTATDGAEPTDPSGARAALSLPLDIRSATNTPPTLTGAGATVEVGGEATVVDLRTFAADPDEGELDGLVFGDVSVATAGVSASVKNGHDLEVVADATAQKGSQQTLTLTVSDGTNDPVPAQVVVSVVGSRKPLATVVDQEVIASSGNPKEVDALANSQAPEGLGPLEVTEPKLPGLGSADVKTDKQTVVITPSDDFFGVADVTFTVTDATKDPDRRVTGRIRVTVKDRPGEPQPPTVTEFGHEFVVLTWEPPEARGGTIEKYELTSADGSIKKECPATTCRLTASDGIENNETYTFRVRAKNEVADNNGGWSEPSEPSGTVRPDTRPNKSTVAPTLTYRPTMNSGELEVTWPAAARTGQWVNLGSPIVEYEVQVLGMPAISVAPTETSVVVAGLKDGTEYTATVRARNDTGKETGSPEDGWSDPSPVSNKESPATEPTAPTAVTAAKRDDPVASVIEVKWAKPTSINAEELLSYTVLVSRNGGAETRVAATQPASSASFQQDIAADLGATYTFRVLATNKAGESPPSAPTTSVKGFTRPKQITSVTAEATKANGEIKLTFTPPSSEGDDIDTYRVVTTPGGAAFKDYASGGILMTGLTNGQNYAFTVAACNQGTNDRYCGAASPATVSTSPYGPPGAPSVSSSHIGGNTIRLNWSAPAPNGRPIDRVEISVDGGGWQDAGALSGKTDRNTGYSQTHCIRARAVSGGQTGPPSGNSCATAPNPPPPPRTISLSRGAAAPSGYWYSVSLSGFDHGERVQLKCHDSVDADFWREVVITVGSGGTYSDATLCYSGDGPSHWVTGGGVTSNSVNW